MSEEMRLRGIIADVALVPRAANEEADALSRHDTAGFSDDLRVPVELGAVRWHILDKALLWGKAFEATAPERRAAAAPGRAQPRRGGRKRPAEERLRARDPW